MFNRRQLSLIFCNWRVPSDSHERTVPDNARRVETKTVQSPNNKHYPGEIRKTRIHRSKATKIRGRWLIDRRAVFVGPGETGIAPEIHTGDDDALKEILTHVTEATKNSTDVAGLYEKFDRRTGRVYYQYKNPVTGKFHGLEQTKVRQKKSLPQPISE